MKRVEICETNCIDEEEFVETWMAYTVSNLGGADPTVETLVQMERNCLTKTEQETNTSSKKQKKTSSLDNYAQTNILLVGPFMWVATRDPYSSTKAWELNKETRGCSFYPHGGCFGSGPSLQGCMDRGSPLTYVHMKSGIEKNIHTPDRKLARKNAGIIRSPRALFSPASFSPTSTTPSSKYAARTNSGKAMCSYGDNSTEWKHLGDSYPSVELSSLVTHITPNTRYMFEQLREKAAVLDDIVDWIGSYLIKKHSLDGPFPLNRPHAEPMVVVGRVCCDANGHLNVNSVLLEGTRVMSGGMSVYMDLHQLPQYSLFPGQVIAAEVLNPTGRLLMAKQLYTDASLPSPERLPNISSQDAITMLKDSSSPSEHSQPGGRGSGPLHMLVAAGPYTQTDTLTYEPLEDLLQHVKTNKPHVLILIGPFVDSTHPHIVDGSFAETFESFFEKTIDGIMNTLKDVKCQVVIVPSWRDAHHHMIYPTPAFQLTKHYPSVLCAPDPCMVDIQGLIVGITSVDVLLNIGKEEISLSTKGDRLGRLASHVLAQQYFYPLYPPEESLNVDLELLEKHTHLGVTPHVLILPSDLRSFIKDINGCVVVNPERLAKGVVGGSFARLVVNPPTSSDGNCAKIISGEVVKI
uniref:DNA polymerase alpha subunit B n=1 Tax=Timema shepardi TaxID=629360 RepID=A0A7R9AUW8_TIMSH|nr:unnamed protein product [Timema shepardi]